MNKYAAVSIIVLLILAAAGSVLVFQNWKNDQGGSQQGAIDSGNLPAGGGNQQEAAKNNGNNGTIESEMPIPANPDLPTGTDGKNMGEIPQEAVADSQNKENPAIREYGNITTCDQACVAIGYGSGYCGAWTLNSDNTVSECANRQELPFEQYAPYGMKIKDCRSAQDNQTKKTICCCKGEPQNLPDCSAVRQSDALVGGVEQPGYLKNPKTGSCCWYRATSNGPQGWTAFNTKAECLAE